MNILFIADIVGSPGRQGVEALLPRIIEIHKPEFVIANAENAAGGFGVTPKVADELFGLGIDVLTSGNHIWAYKEIQEYIDVNPALLRPANYPSSTPGYGSIVAKTARGHKIAVINIMGRTFMEPLDCPFLAADREIEKVSPETRTIVVDIHAEATSEKQALGWYLNGRVSAILGTHTHVQTADERILPEGTAYITDVGMTGVVDSVIGMRKEDALERFLSMMHKRFEVAKGPAQLNAVVVQIDPDTGKAGEITRLNLNA